MKHDIIYVLTECFKGRQWSLVGDNFKDIIYHDSLSPITFEELISADESLCKFDYINKRKNEYPPIAEQLDSIWHAMDIGEIPKANIFYNSLKGIKEKYPKR